MFYLPSFSPSTQQSCEYGELSAVPRLWNKPTRTDGLKELECATAEVAEKKTQVEVDKADLQSPIRPIMVHKGWLEADKT